MIREGKSMKKTISLFLIISFIAAASVVTYMYLSDNSVNLSKITIGMSKVEVLKLKSVECIDGYSSVTHKFDGIKDVADIAVDGHFYFDTSDDRLEWFVLELDSDNEKYREKLKKIVSDVGVFDDEWVEFSFGGNKTTVCVRETDKKPFSIDNINWDGTRDTVKTLSPVNNILLDDETNERKPLAVVYKGIKSITFDNVEIWYYFNDDDTIESVVMTTNYSAETLKNVLSYFDIDIIDYENELGKSTEEYYVRVMEIEDSNQIVIVMENK